MSLSNAYLVGEEKSIDLDRFINMLCSNPIKSTETLTAGLHRRPSRHAFTLKLRLCDSDSFLPTAPHSEVSNDASCKQPRYRG